MAKLSTDDLLEAFKEMTLIELSEFVSQFEETFGVTAAAPVAVAAAPAAGGAAAEAAEAVAAADAQGGSSAAPPEADAPEEAGCADGEAEDLAASDAGAE